MSMSPPADSHDLSLTPSIVAQWEEEARALQGRATELRAEATTQDERAAAFLDKARKARELFAFLSGDAPALERALSPPNPAPLQPDLELTPEPYEPRRRRHMGKAREGTWGASIRKWLYDSPTGLSPAQMRALIREDEELRERFAASDKGFYNALSRLKNAKEVRVRNGYYYSPKAFSELPPEDPASQRFEGVPATTRHSPMGEAILDIVTASPGITGSEIIRRLRTDPEFAAALSPHDSGAYNILARLARRGQVIREATVCYPGPNMEPRDPSSKWLAKEEKV